MKRLLSFVSLILVAASHLTAEDAAALLARVDARRAIPHMDFELTITSYQGSAVQDENTLWGWVKSGSTGNKTLLFFVDPPAVKGRKMLMDGQTVYLLFPKTRNPIRLSPLQILLGQSSNGDVARTGFAQQYDAVALGQTTVNGKACWLFDLAAKSGQQGSAYQKVRLWVEKETLNPMAADFLGSGDQILKHAVYSDYRVIGEQTLAYKMDISDGTDPSRHTVLQFLRVGSQFLPASAFRRDYLEAWSPEAPQ